MFTLSNNFLQKQKREIYRKKGFPFFFLSFFLSFFFFFFFTKFSLKKTDIVAKLKEYVMAADDSEPDQPPPQNDVASISLPHKISDSSEKIDAAKDRDTALARVEWEKKMALIKAWEESEKIKAENKAYKRLSAVESWENTRKASIEAQLMKIEEKMEKKKAEYAEQMKNKIVGIHKEGEEKKATIEAERKEQCLKVEETAEKYRTSGFIPKTLLKCFSG